MPDTAAALPLPPPAPLQVGEITCRVIRDGSANYPPQAIFAGVGEEQLRQELGSRLGASGTIASRYHCVLLETPSATVLVDTGLGRLAEVTGEPAGRLLGSLDDAGYGPEDIDLVLLSHAHPDHIGGLLSDGRLTFRNARHVMSAVEWSYWTDETNLARLPEFMAGPARATLPALDRAACVDLVDHETEVVAGVHLLPAPGHTPGHCVVAVTSGRSVFTLLADAIIDELQFTHLDWVSAFDHSADQTVDTRKRLLHEAAAGDSKLLAYHIGTVGTVEGAVGGYTWHTS